MPAYDERILEHLSSLYGDAQRRHACRASTAEGVESWRLGAVPALEKLVGIERIRETTAGFAPDVELSEAEEMGDYTRQSGCIRTEPSVRIPFWLLRPHGPGPFPLGVFPHGHQDRGMDSYVGICDTEEKLRKNEAEDRDVAVQAVKLGFAAIAPTTRGFEPAAIPDLSGRHGGRNCRSTLMHALLAGRTLTGERVWDVVTLLDWACGLPYVDGGRIVVMGNSGGGVVTLYAAALDARVTCAVSSCAFSSYVTRSGRIQHCDCNMVPGILTFGEFHDVAGLAAPRHLLVVHGREDPLFEPGEVDEAVAGVRRIYEAAGVPERFGHRCGEGGHRFYRGLMWPFVQEALAVG